MADIPVEQLIQTAQGPQSAAQFFGVTEIAPPKPNVMTVPAPVETTDEEKVLLAGFREVPAADEGALAGFKESDPLDVFSDEQLIKDKNFEPVSYFNQSGEGAMDTKKLERLKKVFNARLQEGVSGGGLAGAAGRTAKGIVTGIPHMVKGLAETAERAVRPVVGAAAGAVSEFLPGADARREVIGNWIDTGVAELLGGVEAESVGLSEAVKTGLDKLSLVGKKISDEEAGQILMDWAARTKQAEAAARGEGATFNVAESGVEIDPQAVSDIAAGGPLSLVALGGTFKILTQAGKAIISAPTKTAAMQAFRRAQQGVATAEQAVKAAPTAAKETALQSAIATAEATPKPLLASAAELVPSVETVGGRAIQAAGATAQAGAAVANLGARALRATRPLGIPIGSILGVPLQAAAEVVRRGGAAARRVGAEVASETPGVAAQRIQDIARATRNVGLGVGAGAAIDTGFAVGTAKSDEEARNMPGIGAALGLLVSAPRAAREVIAGEQLAPRRAPLPNVESKAYAENPALDALHERATATMSPETRNQVNLVRETARKMGGRVYVMPDEASFRQVLDDIWRAQNEGQQIPPEVSAEHAQWASQNGIISSHVLGPDGKPQTVAFVRDPGALAHEGIGHVLDRVLPEEVNASMDDAIRKTVSPENWEAAGSYYVERLTGQKPTDWRQGLRDAGIDIDPDVYLAREMRAENLDVAFRNRGQAFATSRDLYNLVTHWAGVLAEKAGVDFGARTPELQFPASVTEAGRGERAVRGLIESEPRQTLIEARDARLRETARPLVSPEVPVSPAAETPLPEVQAAKDWIDANPQKVPTPEAATAGKAIADAISAGEPVRVSYWAAKGTPAGETASLRPERRAEIEAQRGAANEDRQLVEHEFTPYRVEVRSTGPQFIGWSRDILNANVAKFQEWVAKQADKSRVPYETNEAGLTENGLAQLREDARVYQENQANGYTGSGEKIVVPPEAEKLGASKPQEKGEPLPLSQERADVINFLFNTKIPETASRLAPLHLAGQEVSAATLPGRVEIPVRRRGEYSEATLKKAGITEPKGVREVNPFRQWVESQPGEKPSLVEVSQRLNLARIEEAGAAVGAEPVRGNVLTQAAGFQPKPSVPRAVKMAAVKDRETGKIYTGSYHGAAFDAATADGRKVTSTYWRDFDEGFVTNAGEFLSREEAHNRAVELGQITAKEYREQMQAYADEGLGPPPVEALETTSFQDVRSFQPKPLAEEVADIVKMSGDEWTTFSTGYKSDKYGGGLTGWAFDRGSKVKTAEELAALRSGVEILSAAGKEAMANRDMDTAMTFITRSQAMREAYEAATGRTLDGTKEAGATFIRSHFDPDYQPPMAPKGIADAAQPKSVADVAEEYKRSARIGKPSPELVAQVNQDLAKRIADFYQSTESTPEAPAVQESYRALIDETKNQYESMVEAGYKIEPWTGEGEPYKNSADMVKDVRENQHLYYLPTKEAFGMGEEVAKNLLLEPVTLSDGKTIPANDLFRAVHDFFGHALRGHEFGPRGELNAWREHSSMYSDPAQGALAAETLAQNSWVNFGEHLRNPEGNVPRRGEPGFVPLPERPFAEQKNLVVPSELIREASAQPKKGQAEDILIAHKAGGGSTYNLVAGKNLSGEPFFAVSTHPERTKIIKGQPTEADIENFIEANKDLLSKPENSLGTWSNEGKTFLDITSTVADREAAIQLGKDHNQIAIFDLQNFEEIPIGGTGKPAAQPKRLPGEPSERTSMKYFSVEQPSIPETGAKGHQLWDGANFLSEENAKRQRLTKTDEAAKKEISRAIAEETLHALENHPDAVGWYDRKIKDTLETLSELHPEITEDPDRAALFKALIAVTSNGQAIRENFFRADELYSNWKKTGELPTDSKWGGVSAPAINTGIKTLKMLIDEKGLEGARKFLESEFTIGELKKMGFTVPSEKVSTKVRGSNVLGPKVGAFFANLNGDFSPVTMDRWFMRTFNRIRGVLTEVNPKAAVKHIDSVLAVLPEKGKDFGFNVREVKKDLTALRADIEAGKPIDYSRPAVKYIQTRFRDYVQGFTDRSAINRATKLLHEQLFPLHQHPASGGERAWVRENIAEAQKLLKAEGVDLTNADMQALLWYYEKELYAKLGFDSPRAAGADYSSAARELVDERRGLNRPAGEQLELRPRGAGMAGGRTESNPGAVGTATQGAESPEALIKPRYEER